MGMMVRLFALCLLVITPALCASVPAARRLKAENPKLDTYRVITVFASVAGSGAESCEEFGRLFEADATVDFPVGTSAKTPAKLCDEIRTQFAGMGAYPRDLWLAESNTSVKVAFSLHVRAVSKQGCFVDWPSITVLTFNSESGKVSRWQQYYDDGWMDAAIFCKNHTTVQSQRAGQRKSLPSVGAFNVKDRFYENVVAWSTGTCDEWLRLFSPTARLESPVGGPASVGKEGILKFCNNFKEVYIGFGAYPKDLFIADDGSSLATSFHIRALSSKKCHVEWPSVLVVSFDSEGLVTEWMHYYDDGWNDSQLNCRGAA